MISQRRTDDFQGTDSQYIAYLESIVRQVTTIPSPPSTPSPPRSDVRDKTINNSDGDEDPGNSIKCIPYKPETNEEDSSTSPPPVKRPRGQQRWEREMDEMLNDLSANDWSLERGRVGLSSLAKIFIALDMIIGTKPQTELHSSETGLLVVCYDPSNTILQLLDTFGTATAALKVRKTFTTKMYLFRVLVFVSLCCVALHHKVDKSLVDEIMQKCVSDSCGKNLERFRNGALWVNRMIYALAADGFGYSASEFFVLRGRPIAQYGRFAEAGEPGFSYFQSQPGLEQASLYFWIPFIVKTIVGDVYSFYDICTCLDYGTDSQIHDYPRYIDNYHNRRLPLRRSVGTEATAPLADHPQAGTFDGHGRDKETDDSTSIQALLAAAQQSDYLPGSVPD